MSFGEDWEPTNAVNWSVELGTSFENIITWFMVRWWISLGYDEGQLRINVWAFQANPFHHRPLVANFEPNDTCSFFFSYAHIIHTSPHWSITYTLIFPTLVTSKCVLDVEFFLFYQKKREREKGRTWVTRCSSKWASKAKIPRLGGNSRIPKWRVFVHQTEKNKNKKRSVVYSDI